MIDKNPNSVCRQQGWHVEIWWLLSDQHSYDHEGSVGFSSIEEAMSLLQTSASVSGKSE
jgi:hypothetical protein